MSRLSYMKCRQEHIRLIKPQPGFEDAQLAYLQPGMELAFSDDFCLSAWDGSRCIGAAGLIQLMPHYAVAWAFISADAGPFMLEAVRKIRAVLFSSPFERVEMRVRYDFKEGHQLARLLGFTEEAPRMRKSAYFKEDETLYARVR